MRRDDEAKKRARKKGEISFNESLLLGGLALSAPGLLLGPPLLGYWLDEQLGTAPWLLLLFLVAGFVGTGFEIYVILKRIGMIG